MYAMMRCYIFIIGLNCLSFAIFSMKHETAVLSSQKTDGQISIFDTEDEKAVLPLQNPACTIPVLYIDNYIVNVSSAYKALKKEICIVEDMAKGIHLDRINTQRRGKKSHISFLFDTFASQRYIKRTFPQKFPGFLRINAVCSQSLCHDYIDIEYDIVSYVYNTNLRQMQHYKLCPKELIQDEHWKAKIQEYLSEIVVAVLEDMIDQELSGTCGVEVYCPDRLADWLIIQKNF